MFKISKKYLIEDLKRKYMILLSNNGIVFEPDELNEYVDSYEVIIDYMLKGVI